MKWSNKFYDVMKYVVTIALPAFTVFYSALAGIWGWPNAEAVVGTIAAVTVFLGALLNISSSKYKKEGGQG